MHAPTLLDGDLVLRPHAVADLDAIVEQCRDEQMQRWTTVPAGYERRDAAEFLDRCARGWSGGDMLALAVEAGGRFAGTLDLRPDGAGAADLGFGLAPWARGQHLMSRAVRLALGWAFDRLPLEVVHWRAVSGNWASRRVAWACGFTLEGRVRSDCVHRGERRDAWVGTLARGEPMRPATPWLDPPRIEAGRVVLRENRADDLTRILQACSDPVTQRWLPELPSPYTLVDAAWYLDSRAEQHATGLGLYWAVADADDDRLLAQVALTGLRGGTGRSAEIGYWTHPDARGTGVMPTAVRLVARHALLPELDGGLGLERVQLRVADGNVASMRVAAKAGFTACGVDRAGERLRDGSVVDFHRFDLLVAEMELAWAQRAAMS